MNTRPHFFVVCIAALFVFSQSSRADLVVRTGAAGDKNWTDSSSWFNITTSTAGFPASGDQVVMNANRGVIVDSAIAEVPSSIAVNNQLIANATSSTMTITDTGSITTNNLFIGANGSEGILNIESGASLTVNSALILGDPTGPSQLNFELGATGFTSPIAVGGSLFLDSATNVLSINGSAYTGGGPASILLLDSVGFAGAAGAFSSGNISVTGLGTEGVDWSLVLNEGGSGDIVLNIIAVPEPSALSGLCLLAIGLLARRKRT